MTFSRRGLIRVGLALGAFLIAVFVLWPGLAVATWLDRFVPWPIPVGIGLAAAVGILIFEELTTPETKP